MARREGGAEVLCWCGAEVQAAFVSDAVVWVAVLNERTPPLAALYCRGLTFR